MCVCCCCCCFISYYCVHHPTLPFRRIFLSFISVYRYIQIQIHAVCLSTITTVIAKWCRTMNVCVYIYKWMESKTFTFCFVFIFIFVLGMRWFYFHVWCSSLVCVCVFSVCFLLFLYRCFCCLNTFGTTQMYIIMSEDDAAEWDYSII